MSGSIRRPLRRGSGWQAEKPVELHEAILEAIKRPGEVVVDQFAESGNLGRAAMRKGSIAVLFEILKENVSRMVQNLSTPEISLQV
ncbi:DNA methyltransferase [Paenibacillus sp. J2TS4]|uniref:DNA methyltransferase n=1 Tax=Paenibacillus sp. J2TS4 TaxID=2807194 RepID=UPI0020767240|nr:DNA methyltransferase [Paenibacillus sp. J2TS4]